MATLCDFWQGVLFGEGHDAGDAVIEAHRWLDEELPVTEEMFERWLESSTRRSTPAGGAAHRADPAAGLRLGLGNGAPLRGR